MQWALLAVILIGLFLISGKFPKIAFSVFGLLVVAVVATLVLTSDKVVQKTTRISISDVSLSNMTVVPAYGGSYRISGRLQNSHEEIPLRETILTTFLLDCDNSGGCVPVGQETTRLNTRVPAGQARDFQTNLYFGAASIQGTADWRYEVSAVKN